MLNSACTPLRPIRDDHLKALIATDMLGGTRYYDIVTCEHRSWGQNWYTERSRNVFLTPVTYKNGIKDHFSPMEVLRFVL